MKIAIDTSLTMSTKLKSRDKRSRQNCVAMKAKIDLSIMKASATLPVTKTLDQQLTKAEKINIVLTVIWIIVSIVVPFVVAVVLK